MSLDEVAARLARGAEREDMVFGAVDGEGVLVGVAGPRRDTHRKARHRAYVWGMYVAHEARGRGLGRALVESLIAYSRTLGGVERLTLSIVPDKQIARSLYPPRLRLLRPGAPGVLPGRRVLGLRAHGAGPRVMSPRAHVKENHAFLS